MFVNTPSTTLVQGPLFAPAQLSGTASCTSRDQPLFASDRMHMGSFIIALLALAAACKDSHSANAASATTSATKATTAAVPSAPAADSARAPARPPLTAEEKQFYREMAKQSFAYLTEYWQSNTGLVNATPDWTNTTMWDIGAQLLGFHAAKELGLLSQADYDARMTKTLGTLEKAPLYHGAAFDKLYNTKTGSISGEGRPGWSATDLGRFLLALKIIASRDPELAAQAERVARRNDFRQIVKNGYLQGQLIGSNGQPWTFQEGRIGYEQYVANGFAQWGADVRNALDVHKNAKPVTVMNVSLLSDTRQQDRLLSEPFILYGLELGMPADVASLAHSVLDAQEQRYKSDKQITMVSEDAVKVPPDYFYYYCVLCAHDQFHVETATGTEVEHPRWVSTKAVFGWNAIMPSDYTRAAVDYVSPAHDPNHGWSSGVMEGSRKSTDTYDVNTAAVLLEVALYQLRGGKPLIQDATVER